MKRLIAVVLLLSCTLSLFAAMPVFSASDPAKAEYGVFRRKDTLTLEKNEALVENGITYDSTANCYVVSAFSGTSTENDVKIDITALLKDAKTYVSGRVPPSAVIKTDVVCVSLTKEAVEALAKKNKKVYFTAHKSFEFKNQLLKSLIKDARFEVSYGFIDANNKPVETEGMFDFKIPFSYTTIPNINVYQEQGAKVAKLESEYKDGMLEYRDKTSGTVIVSEDKRMEITGRTLELQGTIALVFYAKIEGVDPYRVKMLFWENRPNQYIQKTADRIVELSSIDKNGCRFEYTNIAANDMNKDIYARLVFEEDDGSLRYGTILKDSYSVVKYAKNMMNNKKLKPLLTKMLNYGAAAQEYLGSDDEPANSILRPGEKATDYTRTYDSQNATLTEDNGAKPDLLYIAGKTISIDNGLAVNYYVLSGDKSAESGILFWNEYDYAMAQSHIVGTESQRITEFTSNGDYRVYSYTEVLPRQIYKPIYARAYVKVGNEYRYSDIDKYSVCDYASNQIEKNSDPKLVKLLRCLMLYGEESQRFFQSLN